MNAGALLDEIAEGKHSDPLAPVTVVVPSAGVRSVLLDIVRAAGSVNVAVRTPYEACIHLVEILGLPIAIAEDPSLTGMLYTIFRDGERMEHHEAWERACACVHHHVEDEGRGDSANERAVAALHDHCRAEGRVDRCIAYERVSAHLARGVEDGSAAAGIRTAFGKVILWGCSQMGDARASHFIDMLRRSAAPAVELMEDRWLQEDGSTASGALTSRAVHDMSGEIRWALATAGSWLADVPDGLVVVAYPDSSPYHEAIASHLGSRTIPYRDAGGCRAGQQMPAAVLRQWMRTTGVLRPGFEGILDVVHWLVQEDMGRDACASLAWAAGARGTWQSWFSSLDRGREGVRGREGRQLQRLHEAVTALPQDAGNRDVSAVRWIAQCEEVWTSALCPAAGARGIPLPLPLLHCVERVAEACRATAAAVPDATAGEVASQAVELLDAALFRYPDAGAIVLAPYSMLPALTATHVVLAGMSESYACDEFLGGGGAAGALAMLALPGGVQACAITFSVWDDSGRPSYPHPLLVRTVSSGAGVDLKGEQLRSGRVAGVHEWGDPASASVLEGWDAYLACRLEEERHSGALRLRDAVRAEAEMPFAARAAFDRAQWSTEATPFDGNCATRKAELSRFWQHVIDESPISSQGIESWATCPHQYFLEYVLRVPSERTREEWQWSIEATLRGSLAHRVLEKWYAEHQGAAARSEPAQLRTEVSALMREVCEEDTFRRAVADPVQLEILVGDLAPRLARLLLAWSRADGPWQVLACEQEFGRSVSPASWEAVEIPLADGSLLRMQGVVDRIDVQHHGHSQSFRIVDYKTGGRDRFRHVQADPIDGGRHVQGALYAEAVTSHVERLGGTVGSIESWYLFIDSGWRDDPIGFSMTGELRSRLIATVQGIAQEIRHGNFVRTPGKEMRGLSARTWESCRYCPFDSVCPVHRDELAERKREAAQYARVAHLTGRPGEMSDD